MHVVTAQRRRCPVDLLGYISTAGIEFDAPDPVTVTDLVKMAARGSLAAERSKAVAMANPTVMGRSRCLIDYVGAGFELIQGTLAAAITSEYH
jgi:hypothetical protein